MDLPSPRRMPPDGALICRVDGTGRRIAVLPATCKAGAHPLTVARQGATVHAGEIHLSCPACAAVQSTDDVDHCWRLTLREPSPECAELDDEPYHHLRAHARGTTPVRSAG